MGGKIKSQTATPTRPQADAQDLVRASRDGDQFHYHWGARQCLRLLSKSSDLVAITIEGPSTAEAANDAIASGEELIDVGFYYGSEARDSARLVRFVQLKHSTRHADEAWTASGLANTLKGFAKRYTELAKRLSAEVVAKRFRFEFTTNRPISSKVQQALADLASGAAVRHPEEHKYLAQYSGLKGAHLQQFFALFIATGGEGNLWEQRRQLAQDSSQYLAGADSEAPLELKELVTRKATTEFETNPSIRRHDVLLALKVGEDDLAPAPCLLPDPKNTLPREQERDILKTLLESTTPVVLHADGGVGKSVLAARLAASVPQNSVAVLYDCFGDGLYRSALGLRHRYRDALVQIANELAAQGLCYPLVPTERADARQYMRAFMGRLTQAVGSLRAVDPNAALCIIIDAADNAEMAAVEWRQSGSFVRELIRAPLPDGVHTAFTCRTHRKSLLQAPPSARDVALRSFSNAESAKHLRSKYPDAGDTDVSEFASLSSSNPRVQSLALAGSKSLAELLRQLGPEPTTVDNAIGSLLDAAIARLKDASSSVEAVQIDSICRGLAVFRPLVPVTVLAKVSGTSEGAIRSLALDLGRPLLLKGDSVHFLDEPTETWFRERFGADGDDLAIFVERLKPLASDNSYAAAALPQLLLRVGRFDELVALALSDAGLPSRNALEQRDVKVQRLRFALKASIQSGNYTYAAKIALKAAGECAGEQRQNQVIKDHTDVAGLFMTPDRIEALVARRTFGDSWRGSHYAYEAALMSGSGELAAEGSSRLRMARDWLLAWSRQSKEQRQHGERVSDEDLAELALAMLRLEGPTATAEYL
ncbi:MAG TPA: ATP-binding protein, partial [Kofleriaceae bacterium]